MVAFEHAKFLENTDALRARSRDFLYAVANFYVRTLLAGVWRNLDDRNRASWKDSRYDFGCWNGVVISRSVAFCQARAEIILHLARRSSAEHLVPLLRGERVDEALP